MGLALSFAVSLAVPILLASVQVPESLSFSRGPKCWNLGLRLERLVAQMGLGWAS